MHTHRLRLLKQEMPGPKSPVERRKETQPILTDVEQMEHNGHIVDRTIETVKGGWRQDLSSIILLLVLYTLQGIPMGLSGSIPFLLVDKVKKFKQCLTFRQSSASYDPAEFSSCRMVALTDGRGTHLGERGIRSVHCCAVTTGVQLSEASVALLSRLVAAASLGCCVSPYLTFWPGVCRHTLAVC